MAEAEVAAAAAKVIADRLVQQHENQFPVSSGLEHQLRNGDDQGNKRKFDEGGGAAVDTSNADGPVRKRTNFSGPEGVASYGTDKFTVNGNPAPQSGGMASANPGEVVEYEDIPANMIGKLIGKQGETIKQLQFKTDARIQIDHQGGDEHVKRVTLTAKSRDAIEKARNEIREILSPALSETVECPQGIVGRVIGRGGETIKALQQASEAHIMVDQNYPDGVPRKINISGRPESVRRAVLMVTELINGEPGSAQAIIQKHGFGITHNLDCPKSVVGRVIGKGGETIKMLQKNNGVNIQIDQTRDPASVQVTGPAAKVQAAIEQIKDIMNGVDFGGRPGMGGPGPFGGPGPRGPGGGFPPQYPQQFPGPGGFGGYGGYGGPPPAAAAAYGYGYGGYPPAYQQQPPTNYGGYGGYGGGADMYGGGSYGGYGQSGTGQAAAAPGGSGGQSVWQELHDGEGRPYYYNNQTGQSQWEKPDDFQ